MSHLLKQYRRVQSEIRDLYDPFTASHCPTCATPCCMKPVRVDAIDIALASAHGCALPPHADPEEERNATAIELFSGESPRFFVENVTCDFLSERGCAFPRDLRPYGCTRFICDPMKRHMDPAVIRKIRVLLKRLDTVHDAIVDSAHGGRRRKEARSCR